MIAEESIFSQYRGKRVLVDTNLLLLYLIGSFERKRIARFKRTADFSESDFDKLASFLAAFRTIVTTPHLLTEVNSLANALPEDVKPFWADHFAFLATTFLEIYEPASDLVKQSAFARFGLADAAIQNASRDTLVLTEDFRLSGFLHSQGVAVLNFRDLILIGYLGAS
jgi:hypothetical protein